MEGDEPEGKRTPVPSSSAVHTSGSLFVAVDDGMVLG